MGYRRLAPRDRYQISAYLQSGQSVREIAFRLGVAPSTISRELRKASTSYDPDAAEEITKLRRASRYRNRMKIRGELREIVETKLREDWSPEQIAGRLKLESKTSISHQTIYRFIAQNSNLGLRAHLRILRKQRKDRKKEGWKPHPEPLRERLLIEERPKIVDLRNRIGDFERDTVLGKLGGALILTIVDRTSRLVRLALIEKKSSYLIHQATVDLLQNDVVHTITNDNSTEFVHHQRTSVELGAKIYFSRAYRSWERGTNENTNGLLRQYFPRKCAIKADDSLRVRAIEQRLNSRPRKCLGFKTPLEVHLAASQAVLR